MLTFFTCVALMAPLLRLMDRPSGCGFAIVGEQGRGKSSLLTLIGSVYGGGNNQDDRLVDSWRSTNNGLELHAFYANDRVLLLDDAQSLPGSDPQRAAMLREQIYMLAEGVGKIRKGQDESLTWRTVVITSHNQTFREVMADGRQRHDTAAEKRLLEIPVFGTHGVFDSIPEGMTPAQFADALSRRARRYYGAPFHEFIGALVQERSASESRLKSWLQDRIDSMRGYLRVADHEERSAYPFCLAYAAGRFAREFCDVLPVESLEIREAVERAYHEHYRHVARTTEQVDPVAVLRRYIERNRGSFVEARRDLFTSANNIAGFLTKGSRGPEFSFTTEQFKRAAAPFTSKRACDSLKIAKLLICEGGGEGLNGRNSIHRTIFDEVVRVYCVDARIVEQKR